MSGFGSEDRVFSMFVDLAVAVLHKLLTIYFISYVLNVVCKRSRGLREGSSVARVRRGTLVSCRTSWNGAFAFGILSSKSVVRDRDPQNIVMSQHLLSVVLSILRPKRRSRCQEGSLRIELRNSDVRYPF